VCFFFGRPNPDAPIAAQKEPPLRVRSLTLLLRVGQKRTNAKTWWKGPWDGTRKTHLHPPKQHTQNAEVLTLTYGALVRQLVADLDDVDAVNKQLDQM
jgi:hypothetical protein